MEKREMKLFIHFTHLCSLEIINVSNIEKNDDKIIKMIYVYVWCFKVNLEDLCNIKNHLNMNENA